MARAPFLIYRTADGLVLRTGSCPDAAHLAVQAQTGETLDPAPPANVEADGLWHWTASGYVQSAAPGPSPSDLGAYANAKGAALQATTRSYTSGSTTIVSDTVSATLADWLALQQWASLNPDATTNWVANDGSVTSLPASAIAPIATAVGIYSQSVWQALATVLTQIAAGTITTTAQIDSAAWPT